MRKISLILIYLYAFTIPLSGILYKILLIETVFKPHRIISLILLGFAILTIFGKKIVFNKFDKLLFSPIILGMFFSFLWWLTIKQDITWAIYAFTIILPMLATYFLIINLNLNEDEISRILNFLLIGCLISSGYAFYEVLQGISKLRVSGLSRVSDNFSLNSALGILILLRQIRKLKISKALGLGFLFLLSVGVFFSGTRGIYLSLIICFLFYFFNKKYMKWMSFYFFIIIFTLISTISILVASNPESWEHLQARMDLQSSSTQTGSGRTELWKIVPYVVEDHYFLGAGVMGFMTSMRKHTSLITYFTTWDMPDRGLVVHNNYLSVLVDFSIIGLVCLLMNFKLIYKYFKEKLSTKNLLAYDSAFFFLMMTLLFFLYGFVADLWNFSEFWFIMSLISSTIKNN